MGKRIFWIFFLTLAVAITGAAVYIQSQSFASLVKRKIGQDLAKQAGIEVNFDRLQIHVFPPGFSLVNARVNIIRENNELGLPINSLLKADRVGASFRLFQGVSRGLNINKFFLSGANVDLDLSQKKKDSGRATEKEDSLSDIVNRPIKIALGEELYILVRQLELRDSQVKLNLGTTKLQLEKIKYFSASPTASVSNIVANLENVSIENKGKIQKFEGLSGNIDVSEKEVKIAAIDMQRGEVAAHAEGKLLGTIDIPERMRGSIRLIFRATSAGLAEFVPELNDTKGQWSAELQLEGDKDKYKVGGNLKINDFSYGLWQIDEIETKGEYLGDELKIALAKITSSGGSVSIKPLSIALPINKLDRQVELELNNVDLEKFAGELKKDINNLQALISGTVLTDISFVKDKTKLKLNALDIKPNIDLQNFELNNQVWGKNRPKQTVFKLRKANIVGQMRFKDKALDINTLKVSFPTGVLNASGKVSATGKIDIKGQVEKIDLGAEAGAIADIPLAGVGSFGIHVRGDADNLFLDFMVGTKESKYVNLDFGELNGTLTLDDRASILYLNNIQAQKGQSKYTVSGKISVGGSSDMIELDANFFQAQPDDLFAIFANQIKNISWIPHGMSGFINGHARIYGKYTDVEKTLNVDANLNGKDLLYLGEHVQELTTQAGINAGTYFVKNLRAKKYNSNIAGDLSYAPNGKLKYKATMEQGKLRDIDYFSNFDVPIEAKLFLSSAGEGPVDTLRSNTDLRVNEANVHARSVPDLRASMTTANGELDLVGDFGGGNAKFDLSLGGKGENSRLQLDFPAANFSFLLCMLNKSLCGDPSLDLSFTGGAKFSWPHKDWQHASGAGELRSLVMAKRDYRMRATDSAVLQMNAGNFQVKNTEIVGDATKLNFSASGKADLSEISTKGSGIADMQVLEFLTGLVEEAKGSLKINAGFSGSKDDIDLFGDIKISDGFVRVNGLDAPAETLNGNFHLQNNRATITELDGVLGGGALSGSGYIDLFLNQFPVFNVSLNLSNNRVKFFPVNLAEFDSAKLTFTGSKPPYIFGGNAKARRIIMRRNFDIEGGSKRRTSKYLPEKISGNKAFYEIKIKATADNGIIVQNDLLDAEFRGEVTLLNNFEFPQLTGRGELVKGKLLFRNTAFNLDHAVVRLNNPEVFEPQFSIGGQANVESYKISIFASGSTDNPRITLSANPSLPQEDILSLLAFGIRGDDAKRVSPDDLTAITYTEVGSILLEQLKINKDLQSKGFRLSVTPHVSDNEANIIRPRSVSEAASPKVLVQKKIFSNLDATLGSTFGSSQSQDLDASLEYHFNKRVSIDGVYEQKQTLEAAEKDSSYGADLKFKWGFK